MDVRFIVTNSRHGRLEFFADLGREFFLRQPLQNGAEGYPPSRPIDTGPFFPRIKAGATWIWQLISTWCRAYGCVGVYLYSFLLLARLRSVKRQITSASSYFFSLFSSSFSFFICFPFILYCSHYPFSWSFCFMYVVLFRPCLVTQLSLLIFFSSRRDTFLRARTFSLSRLRDHSHTALGRTSLGEW